MKTANKLTITALLATISIMQAACAQGHANDGSIYQFFDVERQKVAQMPYANTKKICKAHYLGCILPIGG